jgi:hypothetical protein
MPTAQYEPDGRNLKVREGVFSAELQGKGSGVTSLRPCVQQTRIRSRYILVYPHSERGQELDRDTEILFRNSKAADLKLSALV